MEECDEEENVEVTGATITSCLKRRFWKFFQCHIFAHSLPGLRPSDKYPINT
jgi:hypothetical protein